VVHFSGFGFMYQEKSDNPDQNVFFVSSGKGVMFFAGNHQREAEVYRLIVTVFGNRVEICF
jgi:hypothetical protein